MEVRLSELWGTTQQDLFVKARIANMEKKMNAKLFKALVASSLVVAIFTPTSVFAAPSTMPYVGGKLATVQASWVKFGFSLTPKLLTQKPPLKSYHCRSPLPSDLIISQDPAVGSPVSADTQVTLTLACHLETPQNAVVKKPYAPKRGKLKFTPKNLADAKKSTATKKAATKKAASTVSIVCVKGKKSINISGVKPICPAGYKKK